MKEAQERINSAEFAEWMAFYRIEPWGGAAEDHRAGEVCATVANLFGARLRASDFFPNLDPEGADERAGHENPQLEAMAAAQLAMIAAARSK